MLTYSDITDISEDIPNTPNNTPNSSPKTNAFTCDDKAYNQYKRIMTSSPLTVDNSEHFVLSYENTPENINEYNKTPIKAIRKNIMNKRFKTINFDSQETYMLSFNESDTDVERKLKEKYNEDIKKIKNKQNLEFSSSEVDSFKSDYSGPLYTQFKQSIKTGIDIIDKSKPNNLYIPRDRIYDSDTTQSSCIDSTNLNSDV